MDENGNVPCQSKDQCPADFTRTTSVVTYSCEKGLCQENVEEGENILEYVKEDPPKLNSYQILALLVERRSLMWP